MTRFKISTLVLLCLPCLVAMPRAVHAAESYDNCTAFITSVPAVISTQGTWCFNKDLATAITSGNAITINTNNVTLDCNDFKLGGLAAGAATQTFGISAAGHVNVTVRHCNIRGFEVGLFFAGAGSGGHVVEDNRFDANTLIGIEVTGDGSVIRRNRVFDTGGSTVGTSAIGIEISDSVDIVDNTVSGVLPRSGGGGSATGILTDANFSGRFIGNGVHGLLKDGAGVARGIFATGSGYVVLRNNDLVGDASAGSVGLTCSNANGSAKDNVIGSFATAIGTCSDDGGNSIHP